MTLGIGIDLGTTNTCAAVTTAEGTRFIVGDEGEHIHPSVVSFTRDKGVFAGGKARLRRTIDPANTVYSAKRLIGQNINDARVQLAITSLPYEVQEGPNRQPVILAGGRRLTVPEVSAEMIGYIARHAKGQLGQAPTHAVITVPANFSDAQRQATMEAGRRAKLDILRLINEPTAAALAYGYGERRDEHIAIFDFGGGTFDVSILKIRAQIFEVLATDGEFFLGGDDIDRAIAEWLAAEMNRTQRVNPRLFPRAMTRLSMAAEQIKCYLSTATEAEGTIDQLVIDGQPGSLSLPFEITRSQVDNLIAGYVDQTIEVARQTLVAARLEPGDISEVVCVGGSTRIPLVRARVAELFGREPRMDINPDEVVAHGAAIQAANLLGQLGAPRSARPMSSGATAAVAPAVSDKAELGDARGNTDLGFSDQLTPLPPPIGSQPILLDVTPASLGVATAGGFMERIIEKNAPIPIERTCVFSTAKNDQTRVVIECCRGERATFQDNEPLGTLVLDDVRPAARGEVTIEVTFRIDTDGILHIRAIDTTTGATQEAYLQVIGAPEPSEPA